MARFARISAPLLVVAVVYAGCLELSLPEQPVFPIGLWIGALLIAVYFSVLTVLHSQDKVAPRVLAFWGLVVKLAFLPIFLIMLVLTIGVPLDSSNGNVGGLLLVFFILPLDAGVYCLMLVSSFHGFAATKRLLAEQTIPSATVKRLRKMHAVPIADLVAAIWLYVLLRRLDSAAPTSAQDALPCITTEATPSARVPYAVTQCPKNMSSSSK